eukprot:6047711-Amphidinium_carterae.1
MRGDTSTWSQSYDYDTSPVSVSTLSFYERQNQKYTPTLNLTMMFDARKTTRYAHTTGNAEGYGRQAALLLQAWEVLF